MKIKTSELTGAALDWAVATIEHPTHILVREPEPYAVGREYPFSTDWSQGGPIIEREDLMFGHGGATAAKRCYCHYFNKSLYGQFGSTKLVAAMRCYVASKLGDEVDVPEELLK